MRLDTLGYGFDSHEVMTILGKDSILKFLLLDLLYECVLIGRLKLVYRKFAKKSNKTEGFHLWKCEKTNKKCKIISLKKLVLYRYLHCIDRFHHKDMHLAWHNHIQSPFQQKLHTHRRLLP